MRCKFVLIMLLLSVGVFAQTPPEQLPNVPEIAPQYQSTQKDLPDLGRVGVDMAAQRVLELKDALTIALENNKDLEVTRKTLKLAEADIRSARGFFNPRIAGQSYYEDATVPNVSIFGTNRTTRTGTFLGSVGYTGFVSKYGTQYTASINATRVTTTNPISILSPQHNGSFSFTFTQPLLKNRLYDSQRRVLDIARANKTLTDVQFRSKTIDTVTTIERAYWDLAFALRNLQVQRESVRDAKQQLEHNKRLVNEGVLAPVDVIASETQVANLELTVYDGLEIVNRAENAIKLLLAKDKDDALWSQALVPADNVDLPIPSTTLPEALASAMQYRPELEQNRVSGEINKIDQKYYKEQTKPQVDLNATYTSAGIGGEQNPRFNNPFAAACVPSSTNYPACLTAQQEFLSYIGGIGTVPTDAFLNKYPTFKVGITFNIPVGNDAARAAEARSAIQGEQIQVQREQLEQVIQADVRNALQTVRTAEARLRTAALSRENSIKQYESEQRKLEAGQSNIYQVLERQTALIQARSAELRARTELNKAIVDLRRAMGTTLKFNDIEVH